MFNKMKKIMSKEEYKTLSFSDKFISNIVVSMSGGWELFKENSDKLDRLREKRDKSRAEAMKKLKKKVLNSTDTTKRTLDCDKNKTQFLFEDLRKILISLDKDKHLNDDQSFIVFEKKNITLDPNPNADKLTDQEIKKLVNELYELREDK